MLHEDCAAEGPHLRHGNLRLPGKDQLGPFFAKYILKKGDEAAVWMKNLITRLRLRSQEYWSSHR